MITVGNLKHRLKMIAQIEEDISSQRERYERLHNKMIDIGSPELTDMPRNPSPEYDHLSDMIDLLGEIESYIKEQTERVRSERAWVERVLARLSSPNEKIIIRSKYIDKDKWEDILFTLYGGEKDYLEREDTYVRRMYRTHGNALDHMRDVIVKENMW